jgi:serine/threonine protein kinase
LTLKLADMGSAVDEYTRMYLYGEKGPSQAEETREYQPPEVLFHGDVPFDYSHPFSYDMWSVGVVFLELFLGSPHVFSIQSRARVKLDAQLGGKVRSDKYKHDVYIYIYMYIYGMI